MFKLIKILNSGSNVPEPVRLPKGNNKICNTEALRLENNKLIKCGYIDMPDYISLGDFSGNYVICYAVSEDMIFESIYTGDERIIVGSRYDMSTEPAGEVRNIGGINNEGPIVVLSHDNGVVTFKFSRTFI